MTHSAAGKSDLQARIVSGVILAVVALAIVTAGGWITAIGVAAVTILMIWEVSRLGSLGPVKPIAVILLAIAAGLFIWLRGFPNGLLIVFWVPLITAFTDMGGYFVGRRFGKHKLAPTISPKKTIEGAIGGVLAAALIAFVFNLLTSSSAWLILLAIVLSIVALGGDLVASWMKRRAGVKDFSDLIPGHGGFLDRFDALMAVTLVVGLLLLSMPDLRGMWG